MSFYRYLDTYDVHVLDCAGRVDVTVGVERLHHLFRELKARPARDGVHRLLVDFRRTEWASASAHRDLSRATRRDFGLHGQNPALRVAFVSYDRAGAVSGSEHWFDHDEDALTWLVSDGRMEEDH